MMSTVLVVDDDLETLEFLDLFLGGHAVHVEASDYTGDVVGLIRQVLSVLVVLDLHNGPDREAGLSVLTQLRADAGTGSIPVVLTTSDEGALSRHAARLQELHATPVLKPFDVDRVWQLVEHASGLTA